MDFPGEKLVIKLWETLAEKGVGSLLSPWQSKREGRAHIEMRRQEILMLAQAERDAADLRAGRKQLLSDGSLLLTGPTEALTQDSDGRIEPMLFLAHAVNAAGLNTAANSAKSEINASKAILHAEEQLADDPQTPSDRSIDDDWLLLWREHAGRASAEDLQRLWGSVLAGEIKSPGKYSIRTLEFLKTLSKEEAETISKIASYVIADQIIRSQKEYLESKGISFGLLLRMQELGIVSGVEAIGLNKTYKSISTDKFLRAFVSHRKVLVVEHTDASRTLQLEVYPLTEVGKQILGLGSFEPDLEYMRRIGKTVANSGFDVRLADWVAVSENQGQYFNGEAIASDSPPAAT